MLGGLGRRVEALAAIQEAVTIFRELAAVRPDAFRPDLARALSNLSLMLAELGRRVEALAAIQEAVDHLPGGGCLVARCLPPRAGTVVAGCCRA